MINFLIAPNNGALFHLSGGADASVDVIIYLFSLYFIVAFCFIDKTDFPPQTRGKLFAIFRDLFKFSVSNSTQYASKNIKDKG